MISIIYSQRVNGFMFSRIRRNALLMSMIRNFQQVTSNIYLIEQTVLTKRFWQNMIYLLYNCVISVITSWCIYVLGRILKTKCVKGLIYNCCVLLTGYTYLLMFQFNRSSYGRIALWICTPKAPRSWLNGYSSFSSELPTDYHHISIIKFSVRWCVWKVGEGFPSQVSPKTLKRVAVYSSVTFHING